MLPCLTIDPDISQDHDSTFISTPSRIQRNSVPSSPILLLIYKNIGVAATSVGAGAYFEL